MSELEDVERAISRAMRTRQFGFRRRLRSIRRAQEQSKPFDRNLKRLQDEIEKSIKFLVGHMPTHQEFLQQYCAAPA